MFQRPLCAAHIIHYIEQMTDSVKRMATCLYPEGSIVQRFSSILLSYPIKLSNKIWFKIFAWLLLMLHIPDNSSSTKKHPAANWEN